MIKCVVDFFMVIICIPRKNWREPSHEIEKGARLLAGSFWKALVFIDFPIVCLLSHPGF